MCVCVCVCVCVVGAGGGGVGGEELRAIYLFEQYSGVLYGAAPQIIRSSGWNSPSWELK